MHKISKTSQNLIDEFGESAKYHGWQEDMGTGRSVDQAAKDFARDKAALTTRVLWLEERVRLLKTKNIDTILKQK